MSNCPNVCVWAWILPCNPPPKSKCRSGAIVSQVCLIQGNLMLDYVNLYLFSKLKQMTLWDFIKLLVMLRVYGAPLGILMPCGMSGVLM